jgi:hypothetical protein
VHVHVDSRRHGLMDGFLLVCRYAVNIDQPLNIHSPAREST